MPMLTYAELVLQLLRYKEDLSQHGFNIDLQKNQNMYKDTLIIKGRHGFRDFYFSTQPYFWDGQKQFFIYTNLGHDKFTFKINTITGVPHKCSSPTSMSEMPVDMTTFANKVFDMITKVNQQVQTDKLDMNNGWSLD